MTIHSCSHQYLHLARNALQHTKKQPSIDAKGTGCFILPASACRLSSCCSRRSSIRSARSPTAFTSLLLRRKLSSLRRSDDTCVRVSASPAPVSISSQDHHKSVHDVLKLPAQVLKLDRIFIDALHVYGLFSDPCPKSIALANDWEVRREAFPNGSLDLLEHTG
jgi:hypothetical protein